MSEQPNSGSIFAPTPTGWGWLRSTMLTDQRGKVPDPKNAWVCPYCKAKEQIADYYEVHDWGENSICFYAECSKCGQEFAVVYQYRGNEVHKNMMMGKRLMEGRNE
mgnify:CR=1 FL=1